MSCGNYLFSKCNKFPVSKLKKSFRISIEDYDFGSI